MNTSFGRGSAKIYQFPAGGRATLGGRGSETRSIEQTPPRMNEVFCGSCWYHEEAIQEAQASFKPPWER